jgi:phosphoribosylanthranilate isomerase
MGVTMLRDQTPSRLDMTDKVQVAGIESEEEAQMLVDCGVDYLALPLGVPVHKEDLSDTDAARIIRGIRSPTHAVLITYLQRASEVIKLSRALGVSIVQLHGDIEPGELIVLKSLDPSMRIIKSIAVGGDDRLDFRREINAFVDHVDAFIVDTFDKSTGARGATGKTHDWLMSGRIVRFSSRPVILAGGLSADNVRRAIYEVRPDAVDVHTGVENARGQKKRELVHAFVSEARDAFARVR